MRFPAIFAPSCLLLSLFATGCASSFNPSPTAITEQGKVPAITGTLYGGRQPIVGAQVYLFAAGTTAYGGNGVAASASNASTSLLTANTGITQDTTPADATYLDYHATTSAGGSFSISNDYTCTTGTQLYLYSIGGNPGAGTNTAAGLMAILGSCPSNGATGLASLSVDMNEMSTVAAAYSLAGFATDPLHVSTSGSTLAATGIANAAANAAQLYQLNGLGGGGGQPGGGSANATTPGNGTNGGTGAVPQTELNALANVLAACVNSVGPSSPVCTALFADAKSAGTSGTAPTDTATAAINIAHNPTANVTALFNLQPTAGNPYSPALSTAPSNWTVSLAFTGGNLQQTSAGGTPNPKALCVDGSGNVWAANVNSGTRTGLIKFSPLGVPANSTGYNLGNYYAWSCALDSTSSNVWVSSRFGAYVFKYNIAGNTVASYTTSAGTWDIQLDGSGNPWIPLYSSNSLIELNPSTGAVAQTLTGNGLTSPNTLVLEPGTAGNVWAGNATTTSASAFTNAGAAFADDTYGSISSPVGTAIDASGNIWLANANGHVSKLAAAGTSGSNFSAGSSLDAIAIDGAGNAWITDRGATTVYELNNSGTNLTPSGLASSPSITPDSIALDGSGNVWYTSFSAGTLHELIGAAAPVTTPIAYAVANSLLGTRP